MTGLFCERVKDVTSVEISMRRAKIISARHSDVRNLEIVVGNFENIDFTKKYDYVTLIGVLEYAGSFILADNPYLSFLQKVKSLLKPDGKLLLAIENKYGVKYFSGLAEDHTSKYFHGIEDYNGTTSVRTFSRNEMIEMFNSAGFKNVKCYYPCPDYKLPSIIFSDEYLPQNARDLPKSQNFDNDRLELFSEKNAFEGIIRAGMFQDFANSFLFIAG